MDLYNLVVSAKLQKGGGGGGDVDVDPVTITENGVYSASSGHAYSPVTVSVPQSGITPTGTKDINANGIYDVTNFASASVSVPVGVFPSGTSQITSNGIYDIETFKSASVNVPGIVPSGTSSITSNGIYDITNFASVDVNVPGGGGDDSALKALIEGELSGTFQVPSLSLKMRSHAFRGAAHGALKILIDAGVKEIGNYAFADNSGLWVVDLPSTTTKILNSAFAYMGTTYPTATKVICRATTPPTITSTAFSNYSYKVQVPAEALEAYQTANYWSALGDRLVAIP